MRKVLACAGFAALLCVTPRGAFALEGRVFVLTYPPVELVQPAFDSDSDFVSEEGTDEDGPEIVGGGEDIVCIVEDDVCYASHTWTEALLVAQDYFDAGIYIPSIHSMRDGMDPGGDNALYYINSQLMLERAARFSAEPPYAPPGLLAPVIAQAGG
jgi:hypothetical protein